MASKSISERLAALEETLRAPMFGADMNNVTFGMRMVVIPTIAKTADELAAIRVELEALRKRNWNGDAGPLKRLSQWEHDVSMKTTSGHRLSMDAIKVADLWKTLADAASELGRAREIIADNAARLAPAKP